MLVSEGVFQCFLAATTDSAKLSQGHVSTACWPWRKLKPATRAGTPVATLPRAHHGAVPGVLLSHMPVMLQRPAPTRKTPPSMRASPSMISLLGNGRFACAHCAEATSSSDLSRKSGWPSGTYPCRRLMPATTLSRGRNWRKLSSKVSRTL